MKIKELHIQNYKSLVDLKIVEPNPFTVFVGPNGAGKSNIFEALEFFQFNINNDPSTSHKSFGGFENILSRHAKDSFSKFTYAKSKEEQENYERIGFDIKYGNFDSFINILINLKDYSFDYFTIENFFSKSRIKEYEKMLEPKLTPTTEKNIKHLLEASNHPIYRKFFYEFSRIFVNNTNFKQRISNDSNINLSSDCSNLERVLKRILRDETKRKEIIEWLDLLVPGFENIEISESDFSDNVELRIYEKGTKKPFNKKLISDGTYNILALLTAVYQSDEPQFLCIEEPENGLNPKVQKELVNLFRQKCEDEGHYIWLNTHSQTIVNQLEAKELIIVDKVDGATQIKQISDIDTSGLKMDEAWLTNTLGGGIPW